ncbi:MAG: hypothetical protein L0J31_08685, partial [Corynebacterium sp.]|nr:hypothetical protein [Corynebacterium sp.]
STVVTSGLLSASRPSLMAFTDVLDRFRGFALDSQLTDTEIHDALGDGTLVVHGDDAEPGRRS